MNGLRSIRKTLQRLWLILSRLIASPLAPLIIVPAICVALFLFGFIEIGMPQPNPPSDSELIEHYMQHQAEFNKLATLLVAQDNRFVVFPDTERCQIGETLISTRDHADCAILVRYFKMLKLGWTYAGDQPLWLPVYTWGLSVSGFEKGYLYSVEESWVQEWGNIVESTEEQCTMPCFRKIDTTWYIYVDD